MEKIIAKIRNLIDDNLKICPPDIYSYDAINVFTLSTPNIVESTLKVYVDGLLLVNSTGDEKYSFDADVNKLTIIETISAGDLIEVYYSAYTKYSDDALIAYIRSALVRISIERYKTFSECEEEITPTPTETEENMIALVASILMQKPMTSYKTSEITINFSEKFSSDEKIQYAVGQFVKSMGVIDYHPFQEYCEEEDD